MIGEYTLKLLCDKYGISSENIVNKNNNILPKGEYDDIDKTLGYLINELQVSKENIEKCPSILYRNVDAIKSNIAFLKEQSVSFSSIETCLHVLSTEPDSLKDTYKYIEENYGVESINKDTSALSSDKDLIIEIEKLGLDKDWNLAIATGIKFGITSLEEVRNIVNSIEFKTYPELFTSETLAHGKIKDIKKLLEMSCFSDVRYNHLLTSTVVAKAKSMITKLPSLIQIAEYYKIDKHLTTSYLLLSPSQNFALINYLKDNNIPLIKDDKLHPAFGKHPGVLKKRYGIDIKEQMLKYDFSKFNFDKEDTKKTVK